MIIYSSKPLRERDEHDFYPTPKELIRAVYEYYLTWNSAPKTVLDPGCGTGVWGEVLKELVPNCNITGVDIRDVEKNPAYTFWHNNTDFLQTKFYPTQYDLVIGNPPFKYAEQFLDKCFGTKIVFLLRASFLESKKRYNKYWTSWEKSPKEVQISTRRISFTGNKKSDNTMYAIYYWLGENNVRFPVKLSWLDWDYEKGAKDTFSGGNFVSPHEYFSENEE